MATTTVTYPLVATTKTATTDSKTPMATTDQSSAYSAMISADVAAVDVGLFANMNLAANNKVTKDSTVTKS